MFPHWTEPGSTSPSKESNSYSSVPKRSGGRSCIRSRDSTMGYMLRKSGTPRATALLSATGSDGVRDGVWPSGSAPRSRSCPA